MTFKTRTVAKRGRRRTSWQQDTRRNLVLNITFVLAIVAALAILGGVLFSGWYGDHWASVLTVNGKSYSMDDVNARVGVVNALDTVHKQVYTDLRNAGKIGESDYTAFTNQLSQEGAASQRAVTQLQNEAVINAWAQSQGITVDDNDVKAQIQKDSTVGELRHVKVIAVRPVPSDGSNSASQADIDAAQQKAQGFLDRIKGGAKWDDVSKEADSGFLANPSGDLGTGTKESFNLEPALLDSAFSIKVNEFTPVLKGEDGVFRFATVASIEPPTTDPNWESQLSKAGANIDAYHSAARSAALQDKVKNKIVADYAVAPSKQRHVLEIFFNSRYNQDNSDEVKARFAVFAPDKDPTKASTIDANDPKWADAKKRADDAFAQMKADPTKFADITKTQSDDKTWAPGGGELPYLNQSTWGSLSIGNTTPTDGSTAAPAIDELFKPDLKPNQLIGPIKTDTGYVIMQFIGHRAGPTARLAATRLQLNNGVDFQTLARQESDSSDASSGGDMGWIAPYQLDADQQDAIFNAKIGEMTPPLEMLASDGQTVNGTVIFKVIDEQTRTPTADEQARLKSVVFSNWFQAQAKKASVNADQTKLQPLVNPSQAAGQ